MSGTQTESSLSQHDAVNMLLNNAPEQASEEVQEPDAETEVEATEAEAEEVEAVDDQAETEAEAEAGIAQVGAEADVEVELKTKLHPVIDVRPPMLGLF